jgi:hypothetical protein
LTLEALIETIQQIQTVDTDDEAEQLEALLAKQEKLIIEMLLYFDVEVAEEIVKNLAHNLSVPEELAETTQPDALSADALNSRGTREYRPDSAILSRLTGLLKQKFCQYTQLGQCAIAYSM